MLSSVKLSLSKIDLFGKTLIFEEKESQKHNTRVGNVLTFLLLLTSISAGVLFGQEIYLRKNPVVINSNEKISYSKIELTDYPILFAISYNNGAPVADIDKVFDFVVVRYSLYSNMSVTNEVEYGVEKNCDPNIFKEQYRPMVQSLYKLNSQTNGNPMYCIHKPKRFFQNEYNTLNSTMLTFRLDICKPEQRECHPNLKNIVKDIYVSKVTFDANVDPKNYTHPISYYTNVNTIQTNDMFSKRSFITVEIAKLVTNKGWILDDERNEEYLTIKSHEKDLNPIVSGRVLSISLISTSLRTRVIRNYLKVQDLFAKIGGFFNALLIICQILISNYVNFNYYSTIFDVLTERVENSEKLKNLTNSQGKIASFDKASLPNAISKEIIPKALNRFELVNSLNNSENSGMIIKNNFVGMNKNPKEIEEENTNKQRNNKEIADDPQIKDININNMNTPNINNPDYLKSLKVLSTFKTGSSLTLDKPGVNYFIYIWNDIICCNNKSSFKIEAVRKVLSYNNIVKISYENYIKNNTQ